MIVLDRKWPRHAVPPNLLRWCGPCGVATLEALCWCCGELTVTIEALPPEQRPPEEILEPDD